MMQELASISLVVKEYDEAIQYYTQVLNFELIEDTPLDEKKRWVLVRPKGSMKEASLLLAKASNAEQESRIGNQTGGRVFLFLYTDDFDRDYDDYRAKGVEFIRPPVVEAYGKVSVFKDLYGNLWDLIQPSNSK
jgi:uncharacterized glyoxalase superfamily protein PhnB